MIYAGYDRAELDRQYDAAATVPSLDVFLERYAALSAQVRSDCPNRRLAYGEHEREWLDAFPAARAGAPLFVFFHGGYWRRLDASSFSFVAAPVLRAGGACAVVTYPLAPAATMDEIVASARRALGWLSVNAAQLSAAPDAILAGGHSAGAQLAGMAASGAPLGVFGLSGLYDLEPLRRSNVNDWLRLPDADAAERNSPIAHVPAAPPPLYCGVGERETAEFKRQSHAFADAWRERGGTAECAEPTDHNHYTIVLELADAATLLARTLLGMMGLTR